jgi:hypothetical protein
MYLPMHDPQESIIVSTFSSHLFYCFLNKTIRIEKGQLQKGLGKNIIILLKKNITVSELQIDINKSTK